MKIDFITINTSNKTKLEESITFYTNVLGFSLDKRVPAGENITLVFLSDGAGGSIELVDGGPSHPNHSDCPIAITITVDSMSDIEKLVEENSLIVTFGPKTMPSGVSLLHVSDPNGVTINFVAVMKKGQK